MLRLKFEQYENVKNANFVCFEKTQSCFFSEGRINRSTTTGFPNPYINCITAKYPRLLYLYMSLFALGNLHRIQTLSIVNNIPSNFSPATLVQTFIMSSKTFGKMKHKKPEQLSSFSNSHCTTHCHHSSMSSIQLLLRHLLVAPRNLDLSLCSCSRHYCLRTLPYHENHKR